MRNIVTLIGKIFNAANMRWVGLRLIDAMIFIYQATLSPWLGPSCRFEPSCSHYARDAFRLHGLRKGAKMSLNRLSRCRPGGGFGHDPVPMPEKNVALNTKPDRP